MSVAAAAEAFVGLLGPERVLRSRVDRELHSYDASLERALPDLVVFPAAVSDLPAVVATARAHGLPVVMRGAGTGYSGGALAERGGVVVATRDLDAIIDVDIRRRTVRCEPGVVLEALRKRVAEHGLRYLPDPSSFRVCTIGGNLAENAGGPHALGHGPTSNFVVSLRLLIGDGEVVELQEDDVLCGGLDLRALVVGSEGTLGVVLDATLRLVPQPESHYVVTVTFDDEDRAVQMVEEVFAAKLTPTALDMLTGAHLPGVAVTGDVSVLFIDVEGFDADVQEQVRRMEELAIALGGQAECLQVEDFLRYRAELVRDKVRRMIQLSGMPRYYLFDCVVPRSRLRDLMAALRVAADDHGLPLLNTFHAGDGNVHPTPFYDPDDPDHAGRLRDFSAQVLRRCAELGGTLSGEHGIGLEKRGLMSAFYSPGALAAMRAVKSVLDPGDTFNPGKLLPSPSLGATSGAVGTPLMEGREGEPLLVDLADGTMTIADPKVSFADCATALNGSGFELAYRPVGCAPDDSVLGALDAGLPGVHEPRGPRARDLVLGSRFGDGERRLEFGSACAKDVSGYEMRKLAFGGRGRLGRLASVTLRLTVAPSEQVLVRVGVETVTVGVELAERLDATDLPLGLLALVAASGKVEVLASIVAFGGALAAAREQFLTLVTAEGGTVLDERRGAMDDWSAVPRGYTCYRRADGSAAASSLAEGPGCWLPWQNGLWTALATVLPAEDRDLAGRDARLAEAIVSSW